MKMIVKLIAAMLLFVAPAMAAEDQYFNSNGVKIRYTDQGSGDPVILVHGFEVTIEHEWIETGVLQKLVPHYRVVAIDERGLGKSDKPHDPGAYGAEMGMDVLRLMDYLKIQKAHIVGYSLGAGIVAKLVSEHPDRFYTATVGGGAGRSSTEPAQTPPPAANGTPAPDMNARLAALDKGEMTKQEVEMNNDPAALAAILRSQPNSTWDEAKMKAVKVPILAAVGSNDPGLNGAKYLQSVQPSVKLVVINGATHAGDTGALKRPEFSAAILEFLAANPAPKS
jgi:pimeloyl-ACP methyl ester carboxylesterase